MTRAIVALLLTVAWSNAASAHVGASGANGFVHGFSHPFSGIDHVLAMVAVGAFAAHLGGKALWLVPLTFISVLAVAGLVGMAGSNLPFVEIGIGLSVVVLGLVVVKLHVAGERRGRPPILSRGIGDGGQTQTRA